MFRDILPIMNTVNKTITSITNKGLIILAILAFSLMIIPVPSYGYGGYIGAYGEGGYNYNYGYKGYV